MTTIPITLLFADGASRRIDAQPGASVVAVATEAGLNLLTDCSNGQCGTCTANLISGDIELGHYDRAVLPDSDRADGTILTCISRVTGPCVVELPYDISEATAEEPDPIEARVLSVERVAEETVRLEVEIDEALAFEPGQYVRLRPAGSTEWRSYSMANVPGASKLVFYIRLVDGGSFSSWLSTSAAPGGILELSHPHGSFFLRDESRPRLFVAGGTGLAPFLSMLESIADREEQRAIPTALLLGVRTGSHLFAVAQLAELQEKWPTLQVRFAAELDPVDNCHAGYATDLIDSLALGSSTRVYLCGPPPMVEAGRTAAESAGLPRKDMLCERFN